MSFSLPNNLSGLQYKWSALFLHHSKWVEVQQEEAVTTCSVSLGDVLNALSLRAYVVTSSTGHVPQLGFHWPHAHSCWGHSSEEGHIFPRQSPAKMKVPISYGLSCLLWKVLYHHLGRTYWTVCAQWHSADVCIWGWIQPQQAHLLTQREEQHQAQGSIEESLLQLFSSRKLLPWAQPWLWFCTLLSWGRGVHSFFFSWLVFSFSFFLLLQ